MHSWMAELPETPGQVDHPHASRFKRIAKLLIQDHVRPPEAIDGLLGIAHQEQLAGFGGCSRASRSAGDHGRKQQQDLGLERVGILELVHENMGELVLQVFANFLVTPDDLLTLMSRSTKSRAPALRFASS